MLRALARSFRWGIVAYVVTIVVKWDASRVYNIEYIVMYNYQHMWVLLSYWWWWWFLPTAQKVNTSRNMHKTESLSTQSHRLKFMCDIVSWQIAATAIRHFIFYIHLASIVCMCWASSHPFSFRRPARMSWNLIQT